MKIYTIFINSCEEKENLSKQLIKYLSFLINFFNIMLNIYTIILFLGFILFSFLFYKDVNKDNFYDDDAPIFLSALWFTLALTCIGVAISFTL